MNLPLDFKARMKNMLHDEYEAFSAAFSNNPEYRGVRITKPSAEDMVISKLGLYRRVSWCKNGFYVDKSAVSGNHPYHIAGLLYFQEPSAMAPVSALPIEPGDFVLDLCAAPGGKSTQAAEKLAGKGLLVANEIIPSRAEILAKNLERCGVQNAVVTNESPDRLSGKFPEFFDKIIVDAPCSGEGMFRKEPQAVTEWSIAHTLSCALRQRHILDCAVKMLRPGGYLIYSTCTFAPEENEQNAEYILSEYPDMSLVPINLSGLSDGRREWTKNNTDMTYTKRIFPHTSDGEGHFMALFKKDGTPPSRETPVTSAPPGEFSEFAKNVLKTELRGKFFSFGEHLYLLRADIDLSRIKTIRAGQYLGVCKKKRFEPSHALCLALSADDFAKTITLASDSDELSRYLRGETLPCSEKGWICVLADGFPIGWGKASEGILKNRFPKKYRLKQ